MNNFLSKSAAVATACLLASMTYAGAPMGQSGPPFGHEPAQMAKQMADRLDLSDDQQAQITALLISEKENVQDEREQLKSLREQLASHTGEFDSDNARETADKIGVISGNLAYARAYSFSKINNILTEEQQAQLGRFMADRNSRRGERHKRR